MGYWNFILCMCRKCPISTTGWSTSHGPDPHAHRWSYRCF